MESYDWVEVRGPNVEKAIEAALTELGLNSADEADVEVIQEPQRGFLGMGGQDALVRVKIKEQSSGGRTRRTRSGGGRSGDAKPAESRTRREPAPRSGGRESQPRNSGSRTGARSSGGGSAAPGSGATRPAERAERPKPRERAPRPPRDDDDREDIPIADQSADLKRFLVGLLSAFGLEGEVRDRIEDDAIYMDVVGEQTEALVGPKGSILQGVLELCRTIVQRKTMSGAKIRLDINGYTERRREALRIYTARLAEKVKAEGGEVMLEPMNAADRKVVHDTVAEIDGIRSFSEGEEPRRSVVIAAE